MYIVKPTTPNMLGAAKIQLKRYWLHSNILLGEIQGTVMGLVLIKI